MRLVGDIALDAEVRAIASGAITDGAPVVVNADGTVSKATTINESLSSASTYGAISTAPVLAVDTANNRIVIAGRDADYGTGKAIVGTIDTSNDTVSFGSFVEFEDGNNTENFQIVFDSNSNKVVIVYTDSADSGKGKAVVGTVDSSDNSISFGTIVEFEAGATSNVKASFDSNSNKVIIVYKDAGNSYYFTSIVGTVSGTDISFGTAVVIVSSNYSFFCNTFDSSNNKVVVGLRGASSHGQAYVGTVSGTGISWGTVATFHTSAQPRYLDAAFDTNVNKVIFSYMAGGDSNKGYAVVGTVSGTDITFGTPTKFHDATISESGMGFDSTTNKFLIAYKDDADSDKGKYITGSISGTTPSFGSETVLDSGRALQPTVEYDTGNKRTVINYRDTSGVGTIKLLTHQQEKLTSENFIGFAHAAYADGQKATVKTTGSIARNIPQVASASSSIGTAVVFESANSGFISATFDSNSNKVVIAYRDIGNSEYGTAVVGTVSGTSVSFGTPVVFESASSRLFSATFDSNSNKVVIAYRDDANSQYGTAIVGTVSGTSISFGSPTVFESANVTTISATFDSSNNKVVIAYTDDANSSYGTAIVGTVSSTSISFGSATVFESASANAISATFDSNANKVVIAYADNGNSTYGTAIVGTVSGTSISFGSASVFESASSQYISATFDSSNNKVVIAYKDQGNSNHGTAIVGTVSSTSISFGSATVFESAASDHISATFDSNINKIVIAYEDEGNSDYGTVVVGTVSGTSISFGSAEVFKSASSNTISATFDSNANKVVIGFKDAGNSNYGTAVAIATAGSPEDLTIGQQYFVQTDGTLGTSADDPSVIAGTAIGASDIIVKG